MKEGDGPGIHDHVVDDAEEASMAFRGPDDEESGHGDILDGDSAFGFLGEKRFHMLVAFAGEVLLDDAKGVPVRKILFIDSFFRLDDADAEAVPPLDGLFQTFFEQVHVELLFDDQGDRDIHASLFECGLLLCKDEILGRCQIVKGSVHRYLQVFLFQLFSTIYFMIFSS